MAIGDIYIHKKYGKGEIVKDEEGLCRDSEVMFHLFDNVFSGLILDNGPGALHHGNTKIDIVSKSDLGDYIFDVPDESRRRFFCGRISFTIAILLLF